MGGGTPVGRESAPARRAGMAGSGTRSLWRSDLAVACGGWGERRARGNGGFEPEGRVQRLQDRRRAPAHCRPRSLGPGRVVRGGHSVLDGQSRDACGDRMIPLGGRGHARAIGIVLAGASSVSPSRPLAGQVGHGAFRGGRQDAGRSAASGDGRNHRPALCADTSHRNRMLEPGSVRKRPVSGSGFRVGSARRTRAAPARCRAGAGGPTGRAPRPAAAASRPAPSARIPPVAAWWE